MPVVQSVDTIIAARWILPITPRGTVYENCSVVIQEGRIIEITPTENIEQRYTTKDTYRLNNHVVMPGLINAHGHAAMTLLRGYADDLPLMTWLQDHIWPAEASWVDAEFVADGTRLAIAEMILSGTTCYSDMYFFPEAAAKVSKQAGLRAQITFPILDFPTNWASDADDYIHKGLELIEQYRLDSSIQIGFGPHAPYTVSDEPLKRIAILAEQLQAPIHIHAHETAFEVEQSIQHHGVRPLQRLFDLGVLGPLTQCVHMTQITQDDIKLLQTSGASVVHCPESNLKLASGLCPVEQLLRAGITVALGTDGAASNNDLDMFGELHSAALLGKVVANSASALNAAETLEMATLGGARALGIDANTGSLETGKAADIIAVDLSHLSQYPTYDLISGLVYNNRHSKVSHVWVDGRKLLENGQLLTLKVDDIIRRATSWQNKIRPSKSLTK